MSNRILKINELLKREAGILLDKELGREWGLVTITKVETTPDLREAVIWISALDEKVTDRLGESLESIASKIQHILNKRLVLRYVPKITFKIDESQKSTQRIEKLLQEIKETKDEKPT